MTPNIEMQRNSFEKHISAMSCLQDNKKMDRFAPYMCLWKINVLSASPWPHCSSPQTHCTGWVKKNVTHQKILTISWPLL